MVDVAFKQLEKEPLNVMASEASDGLNESQYEV